MTINERLVDYRTKHSDALNLGIHTVLIPLVVLAALTLAACLHPLAATALATFLAALFLRADLRAGLVLTLLLAVFAVIAIALAAFAYAALLAALFIPAAIGLQGVGHARERVKAPLGGPASAIWILTREQLYLAPLFLTLRALHMLPDSRLVSR